MTALLMFIVLCIVNTVVNSSLWRLKYFANTVVWEKFAVENIHEKKSW